MKERYLLAKNRLEEIKNEQILNTPLVEYFHSVSRYLIELLAIYEMDIKKLDIEKLKEINQNIYSDILPEKYDNSFANPIFAKGKLGDEMGGILSFLYAEIRGIIPSVFENNFEDIVIHLELFIEIYCVCYQSENEEDIVNKIKDVIYWFVNDYSEIELIDRLKVQYIPENQFAVDIVCKSDLNDLRYLYQYGEYISENEVKLANYINGLDESVISKMAYTFTNGFQMGFINGRKDLSIKEVVTIRYSVGFERVVKKAIEFFDTMGLKTTIYRAGANIFHKKGIHKIGYYGAVANRQYDYDHKEDEALFMDKKYCNRKLEILKLAYEENKKWMALYAGVACMEVFGEEPFTPISKKESYRLSEKQQKLLIQNQARIMEMMNEYNKPEERSFTIIAFPMPSIGEKFEEIFEETIKINTLDYKLYEEMQQKIIDVLDKSKYVHIVGKNGNKTDLKVYLHDIEDEATQTKFENCLADVNIPVGEVFTSPVHKNTTGKLHVNKVYLNELQFKNLELNFVDGMATSYTCTNFEDEKENVKYVKENVLGNHDSLPMGEFAIGTNTVAYEMAAKYDLEDKLPILIAEKTGPHFAVGDTCYSHNEEIATFNPNGKEMIARENERSILRNKSGEQAYYYHHLDVTIPYNEICYVTAVSEKGNEVDIIREGRFVLEGLDVLNEPFDNHKACK